MCRLGLLAFLLSGAVALTAHADAKRAPKEKPPEEAPPAPVLDPNQCARAEGSARYIGLGYTHVITLRNGCPKPVACSLWTDVDPEPKQAVVAKPGESVEVVTRRGSPASALTAFKSCSFR
jgi:hypothetical protein